MDYRIANKWYNIVLISLMISWISGCATVGPDYVPPESKTPVSWHAGLTDGLTVDKADNKTLMSWWKTFNDPVLTDLIEKALVNNLDVKEAEAKIRESRARRGISNAERFPEIDASASASSSESNGETGEYYTAGFDAGWEIDLFGGTRRAIEAADANIQASREQLHDVWVSLAAEVALNYTELRTYQAQLSVAEANLEAQQETYQLVQSYFDAGLSDALSRAQARSNVESTAAQIPSIHTGIEEAKNRLSILLGEPPGTVNSKINESAPLPVPDLDIAMGLPANTLKQRPDVRYAEWALIAQTAQIGVAEADLYPSINLTGSIGLEALTLDGFFSSGNRTSSIGPRISWSLFHSGAIRQNIEVQSSLAEQALYQYKAAVLNALEEVENALVAYGNEQLRYQSLLNAAEATEQAAFLSRQEYTAGLIDFQTVLDAERSLLSVQEQVVQSEGTIVSNLIRLYKSLGGGWTGKAKEK